MTGQTKSGFKAPYERIKNEEAYVTQNGVTGAPPWSQAWGSQANAWWPGCCPQDPAGHSLKEQRGSRGQEPRRSNPMTVTLAMGTWNVTLLGGKEPELVLEVERYRVEIVGLISTHSLGSGTQLLERLDSFLLRSCPQ